MDPICVPSPHSMYPHPNVLPTHTDVLPTLTVCLPSTSHCCHPLHATTATLSILPPSPSQLLWAPDAALPGPLHTPTLLQPATGCHPWHTCCARQHACHCPCHHTPLPSAPDITCAKCLLELWGWGGLVDGLGAQPTRLVEQVVEGLEVIHAAQWIGAHHT